MGGIHDRKGGCAAQNASKVFRTMNLKVTQGLDPEKTEISIQPTNRKMPEKSGDPTA